MKMMLDRATLVWAQASLGPSKLSAVQAASCSDSAIVARSHDFLCGSRPAGQPAHLQARLCRAHQQVQGPQCNTRRAAAGPGALQVCNSDLNSMFCV